MFGREVRGGSAKAGADVPLKRRPKPTVVKIKLIA